MQVAMEHIMTLTEQNKSLQMECYQLMAVNAEMFQKSVALQYECNKFDAKIKEMKTSMSQALKEIRKEAFGYANIEENKKPAIIQAYLLILYSPHYLTCSNLMLQVHHPKKRTQLKISFMPH